MTRSTSISCSRSPHDDFCLEIFSSRTFKHVLVPIWLLVYMFGSRNFQVVVNGYTGRIAGRYPYSPWKIALLIVLAIIAFVFFVIANENS